MTQVAGRKRALVGLTATALLGLAAFAPAASAQVGSLTESVGSTTSKVTEGVKETVSGPVTETVKEVAEPVATTGGGVVETVDKVGTGVDNATGGSTYEKTKEIVKNTTQATGEVVQKTAGSVGQAIEETSGGLITNPDLNPKSPAGRKKDGKSGSGPAARNDKQGSPSANRQSQVAAVRDAQERAADRLASLTASERNRGPVDLTPASATTTQRDSFMSNLAEAAGEAAKKLAFPLGLALMVGAFLMVQGRIDRKDAKLALAPIDSEQDLLSFQ